MDAGRTGQAVGALENFVRRVENETPRSIDADAAADLVEFARDLIDLLD